MERAIVKLPDWEHPVLNGKTVALEDVEHILITGSESIPSHAFKALPNLVSVEIADDVKGIETYAFNSCHSLKSVHFGKGIRYIGDGSFFGPNAIEELSIPGNVKSIGMSAFRKMNNLKSVILEEGVEEIGLWAFDDCFGIEHVSLPYKSLNKISDSLFIDTKWLRNYPDKYIMLGDMLLCYIDNPDAYVLLDGRIWIYKGKKVPYIRIPDQVKKIGPRAFQFSPVKTVEVGKGIESISEYAFTGSQIENIILPDGLVEIKDHAFSGCKELKNVIIPDSVIHIGFDALQPVNVADCPDKGCVYAGRVLIRFLGDSKRAVIKEGTCSISPGAFYHKLKLETIILPETIREICCSFDSCSRLSIVVIPRGVPASCLDPFAALKGIRFMTWAGSEADDYAKQKGIAVEYLAEDLTQDEIIQAATKRKELTLADYSNTQEASPSEWFKREGNVLAGLSRNGIEAIKKGKIKTLTLPVEKDGYKLERLKSECLSCLDEAPEVEELVIPEGLNIPGVTNTSGMMFARFPNCKTIKHLVFLGKTDINFYQAESLMFADGLEAIKIQKSDRFKSVDGVIYSRDGKKLVYYPRSKKNKKYVVKPGTESISNRAFCGVKYLQELVICDSIDSMYFVQFDKCGIKKISIPGTLKYSKNELLGECNKQGIELIIRE